MTWKPHTTVAAIIERDNKFLMVEEKVQGMIVYNQPAGHLEPNESLYDAVIRETREETAWGFTPEALIGIYLWEQPDRNRSFMRFAFCGKCYDHDANLKLDDGIINAVWMSKDELIKSERLRSPMALRNIDDYLQGIRHPLSILSNIDITS